MDKEASSGASESGVAERFHRNLDLFGAEGMRRIREARVAVVGLGGVGSHAALALARSGVGRLLLVDSDVVTASSLNRSPVAGPGDIGRPKTDVLAEHLSASCPDTALETSGVFAHEPPNTPRQYGVEVHEHDLILRRVDGAVLLFRRMQPGGFPEGARRLLEEERSESGF